MYHGLGDEGVLQGDAALAAILGAGVDSASPAEVAAAKGTTPLNPTAPQVAMSLNSVLSDYGWLIALGLGTLFFVGRR